MLNSVRELKPRFDKAQSFYGKARIELHEGYTLLVSYDTVVAKRIHESDTMIVYDTHSVTTLRHIKEYLKQNGFLAESKQQILKDYGIR